MRNRTSQPGIRTTNAHTNATLEKQNKLPTVQLMLFCRLSDIVAHPVGTGSTSNNSRSSDDTGTPSSQNYNGGTLRAQTMESHFPMSMKSAAHIRDILATRITMGERSGHRPGTDLGIAFPNEYAVRTAHWRHPYDQNYNGAPSRAQTKCTFHHTFVHSTRTISAEGCSRANLETRITMGKRKIDKTLSPEL